MAITLTAIAERWRRKGRSRPDPELEELRRRLSALEERVLRELGPEPDRRSGDDFYYAFEERFRGASETIRARHAIFLPYLQRLRVSPPAGDFLDLGCGRGEWLEILRDHGLPARGIDNNLPMVESARDRGLKAEVADILPYLRSLPDSSLSGFSAFHVIEHLTIPTLLEMVAAARRLLDRGGLLILETPNPESLIVGSCDFWIDPTHRRPVPPTLLLHVVADAGFHDAQCVRVPSGIREFPENVGAGINDSALKSVAERMRIERDYAVIAFKEA